MKVDRSNPAALVEAAVAVLRTNKHAVLATVGTDGRPWAVPVTQTTLRDGRITWRSAIDTRHSHNLAVSNQASLVLYSTDPEAGQVELAMDGTAEVIEDQDALARLLDLRFPDAAKRPPASDFSGESVFRMYTFTPTRAWLNDDLFIKTEVDLKLMLSGLRGN